jgi:hypothetical protein
MRPCIWYHTADKNPGSSGFYLSLRGWGIAGKADYDSDYGYLFYDKKRNQWREYDSINSHDAIVYYWTEADPGKWVDNDPPVTHRKSVTTEANASLKSAWENVEKAVEQYNLIKALSYDVDQSNR